MDNYVKTFMYQMSRRNGLVLTERHLEILRFTYDYYQEQKVGPLYQMLWRKLGASRQELEQLFPHGLASIYAWVGIPVQSPSHTCKPLVRLEVAESREVYLDHAATTPIRPEIARLLGEYFQGKWGFANPSSSTRPGKQAHDQVFKARQEIARVLRVATHEIIFTSGGTEANNLALRGMLGLPALAKGHIVSSSIEHSSILKPLDSFRQSGVATTLIDPEPTGLIDPAKVAQALRPDTCLVALMVVNNELGTLNPIEEIGQLCQTRNIPFMVDAVQAFGKIPLLPKKMGISLLSCSGHKIYGPKGIGALFVDDRLRLAPQILGGGQEFGLRSGTENVASIMALGRAATLMNAEMMTEQPRLRRLAELFQTRLAETVPDAWINGSPIQRLPHILNVAFPGIDSGSLQLSLNEIGVYVSSGAACSAGSKETSHVIRALGLDPGIGIIRFSLGLNSSVDDIEYLFTYLPEILAELRQNQRET